MRKIRRPAVLLLILALLFGAARAEWHVSKENIPRFQGLFNRLKISCEEPRASDWPVANAKVEAIRKQNPDDGDVAQAIVDHWFANVLDEDYPMYIYRGGETASELAEIGPDFGEKHAFVVMGFRLENGSRASQISIIRSIRLSCS